MVREIQDRNRRNVLKTVGTGAIGSVSPIPLIGNASAVKDTVKITTVKSGDTPIVQKEVPRDWWLHELKARRVCGTLKEKLASNSNVESVSIGTVNEYLSGKLKAVVEVAVKPGTSVQTPSTHNNIPINVVEREEVQLTRCNTNVHDPMPGGVEVNLNDGTGMYGSSTCKVEKGGNYYMMTAAHIFYSTYECNTGDVGTDIMYHSIDKKLVGSIEHYDIAQDWALAEHDSYSPLQGLDNSIADAPGILAGRVTKNGLADMKGSTTIYKRGVKTCRTNGTISNYNVDFGYCGHNSSDFVKCDLYNQGGDSGGPIYHKFSYNGCEYLSIIGSVTGYGHPYTYGPAAYKLYDDHSICFDPNFALGYCH